MAIHPDDGACSARPSAQTHDKVIVVTGGATRQDSVRLGLAALRDADPDKVLIHDAARPFVDPALIDRVIAAIGERQAALPALPVADTLKRADADDLVSGTVARDGVYAAQTPQGFPFWPILAAHQKAHRAGKTGFTDDAAIAEWTKMPVRIVAGSPDNVKLTWARDIAMADQRLSGQPTARRRFPTCAPATAMTCTAFEPGDHVTLCGVSIPHAKKLSGHSDADVGAARADRRAARHLRRRRHRHAFPALRSAMAGRCLAGSSSSTRRAWCARAAAASPMSTSR